MSLALETPTAGTVPNPVMAVAHRRSLLRPILIGATALALVVWLASLAVHAYRYQETDNAYIIGRLHQIGPQIDGQVKEVLVNDNQVVQAGDVLLRLDPVEFEIAVQKARAALALDRARLAQANAQFTQAEAQAAEAAARVVQAEAQVQQADAQLDLAQIVFGRNERLLASGGAVTQADVDNSRSALRASEAAQAAARANVTAAQAAVRSLQAAQDSFRAQVVAADASVKAGEADVRDAERKLGYATITAPTGGRIGNRAVETGNRVLAGQAVFALADPDVWVVANFKETQLARIVPGTAAELTIDALPGEELHGKVDSLAPASGAQFALLPPDNATGNFNKVVQRVPVKITLDPADLKRLGDRLRVGFSVIVKVRVR